MLWVDPEGIESAGATIEGAKVEADRVRGHATASLGSIARWDDQAVVGSLLGRAVDRLGLIALDHRSRAVLGDRLAATSWSGLLGTSGWTQSAGGTAGTPSGSGHIATPHDDEIEDLTRRIDQLESAPGFTGKGHALTSLYEELRKAREGRLASLVEKYHLNLPGGFQAEYRVDVRAAMVETAGLLGLDVAGFREAGQAMIAGMSPSEAMLDPLLFPADYVAAHVKYSGLLDQRAALAMELGDAYDAAAVAAWTYDGSYEAAWEEVWRLEDELAAVNGEIESSFGDGLAMDLAGVALYLDRLLLLDDSDRARAIGGFLADEVSEISSHGGDIAPVGDIIVSRLGTPEEAAAFYEAMQVERVQVLPSLVYRTHPADVAVAMEPFARVMARATRHDGFALSGTDLVGEYLDPDAAAWFTVGGYDPAFLVDVAVAQAEITRDNVYMPSTFEGFYDGDGNWVTWDSRALVAGQIATADRTVSQALVQALSDERLLNAFLHPSSPYGDHGTAAGAVLAQLGTGLDQTSARLIVEVMQSIANRGADGGLSLGAALMVAPHVASFVSEAHAGDLQQTPVAALVQPEGDVVTEFLAEVLDEEASQDVLFGAGAFHLVAALDENFDPHDPSSIAASTAGYGEVMDLLVSATLDQHLADARRQDEINALVGNVLSFGIDLAVAAGIAFGAPAAIGVLGIGGPAAIAFGIGAEVSGAAVTNIVLPSMTDFGLATDNAEHVLESGYTIENELVYGARRQVLARLHAAGVVTLPPDWFVDGELRAVPESEWDAFVADLAAVLPDGQFYEWLNHSNAIGGAIDWKPGS